jgi:hypothetical protein
MSWPARLKTKTHLISGTRQVIYGWKKYPCPYPPWFGLGTGPAQVKTRDRPRPRRVPNTHTRIDIPRNRSRLQFILISCARQDSNSRPLASDTVLATLHQPVAPKSLS